MQTLAETERRHLAGAVRHNQQAVAEILRDLRELKDRAGPHKRGARPRRSEGMLKMELDTAMKSLEQAIRLHKALGYRTG